MGYALNELANLPVDENIHFYIFVINGAYRDPLYDTMQENFINIARSIGKNAAIAVGTDPESFTTSVAKKYLGGGNSDAGFVGMLPALLITDSHPDRLSADSMRLVVPLKDAESRFGGWTQFFRSLSQFVRRESDDFIERFEKKEDFIGIANNVVSLKPGMFGVGININELISLWRKSASR